MMLERLLAQHTDHDCACAIPIRLVIVTSDDKWQEYFLRWFIDHCSSLTNAKHTAACLLSSFPNTTGAPEAASISSLIPKVPTNIADHILHPPQLSMEAIYPNKTSPGGTATFLRTTSPSTSGYSIQRLVLKPSDHVSPLTPSLSNSLLLWMSQCLYPNVFTGLCDAVSWTSSHLFSLDLPFKHRW